MAFTIVFEGDITKLAFNPMRAKTVFGKVIASGIGNAFDVIENIIEIEEAAESLVKAINKYREGDDE